MASHWYSSCICIKGARREGSNIQQLSSQKAQDFIQTTKTCLDNLKKTRTGAALIDAIDAAGHKVSIYRVFEADGGNAQGGGDDDKAMVVPLDGVYPDGTTELHRVLEIACYDTSGRSKIKKFFGIGKSKPRFLNRDAIAKLVGISTADLKAAEAGKKPLSQRADSKLRSYLYDFLTPGDGDACYVKFNHTRDNLSPDHKRYLPQSHNWQNRPPAIALGHELIHAWRVVAGRVLFDYGWEEEAMTVGLPPFGNMEFSENRIRVEWGGLAVRPDYQHIRFKAGMLDPTSDKMGIAPGTNAWQGDSKALHAKSDIGQAMAQRRQAMGYDDDGFD